MRIDIFGIIRLLIKPIFQRESLQILSWETFEPVGKFIYFNIYISNNSISIKSLYFVTVSCAFPLLEENQTDTKTVGISLPKYVPSIQPHKSLN